MLLAVQWNASKQRALSHSIGMIHGLGVDEVEDIARVVKTEELEQVGIKPLHANQLQEAAIKLSPHPQVVGSGSLGSPAPPFLGFGTSVAPQPFLGLALDFDRDGLEIITQALEQTDSERSEAEQLGLPSVPREGGEGGGQQGGEPPQKPVGVSADREGGGPMSLR